MTTPKLAGHTPGPWEIVSGLPQTVGSERGKYLVAFCHAEHTPPRNIEDRRRQAEANARLIAAAPDLLRERDELREALVATVEALEAAGADGETGVMPSPTVQAARALLAKVQP